MIPGWSPIKVVQTGCISRSQGQKIGFQNANLNNLLVWNYKAQSFYIWDIASARGLLPKLVKSCPWGQKCPRLGVTILHWIIFRKLQTTSSLEPLMGIWPNFTGMIPGWSLTEIVQMVLIGCINRSQGQKIGFQNAIFKNLLVWNYKAQGFHIWSSTNIWWTAFVVLCKWLHCDLWSFPQVSDPGIFVPSCLEH